MLLLARDFPDAQYNGIADFVNIFDTGVPVQHRNIACPLVSVQSKFTWEKEDIPPYCPNEQSRKAIGNVILSDELPMTHSIPLEELRAANHSVSEAG